VRFPRLAAIGLAASSAVASVLFVAGTAVAASSPATISISPTRVEVPALPGKTVTQTFTLQAGAAAMYITSSAVPFTQNAKGQIVSSTAPASVSGVSWVTLPKPFTLAANTTRKVAVKITEPYGAQPGQRYVAVAFRETALSQPGATGAHMSVSGSVAGELIINVPGMQTHTTRFGLSVPSIAWSNSVSVTVTAQDTGNSLVTLNNQFVKVGGQSIPMDVLLLGGTSRVQTVISSPGYGIDTVTYNGISRTVYVIPGELLAIAAGFTLLLVGIILLARRSGAQSARQARRARHARG